MGLVCDVFNEKQIKEMKGHAAIGHVRYSTTGGSELKNAQPLLSKFKLGDIAIAHNGNLVNADVIRELIRGLWTYVSNFNRFRSYIKLIARGAKKGIEKAVVDAIQAIKGSYAIVMLTKEKLIGVRDQNGIRPLCIGTIGNSYVLASESCALDAVGAEFLRDVKPGEIVIIDENGLTSINFQKKLKMQLVLLNIYILQDQTV